MVGLVQAHMAGKRGPKAAKGAGRLKADGPGALEHLRQVVAEGTRLIRPLDWTLDAAAHGRLKIPLPPAGDSDETYVGKSNAHKTALALAEVVLRRTWAALDPSGYQEVAAKREPWAAFDPAALAGRLPGVAADLATVLPEFDYREVFDACRCEAGRAAQLPNAAGLGPKPAATPATAARPAEARHSPDFRSVHWYGGDFTFTPTQAACVGVLWEAWENGTPNVSLDYLLERAGSEGKRLSDLFKHNPAWKTMIVTVKKGTYRLRPPDGD
jgi:hypothetical protein